LYTKFIALYPALRCVVPCTRMSSNESYMQGVGRERHDVCVGVVKAMKTHSSRFKVYSLLTHTYIKINPM
jgi:hypothetical protein